MAPESALNSAGARVAYVTPDGSGRSQIRLFVFGAATGAVRSVTTASTGISTEPRISGDGNIVVFESTANLVGRGNADGNQELFLYNVARDRLAQLTTTSSMAERAISNSSPSIDETGAKGSAQREGQSIQDGRAMRRWFLCSAVHQAG